MYGKLNILSNEKHNFLRYVVWQPLYMQTVTSAENGGRFPSPYPILRFHVTSPILGERISAIMLSQQSKQFASGRIK